jgi:hypothetical protein
MPLPDSPQAPLQSRSVSDNAARSSSRAATCATLRWSASAKAAAQMQRYNELIERLVRYLMREGQNFIEAYDEVLTVGRLDPKTSVYDFAHLEPTSDREALLGFKAHNAIARLQRHYAELINQYEVESGE